MRDAIGSSIAGLSALPESPQARMEFSNREGEEPMSWDFQTEPEFEAKLAWMRDFMREEVWPLEAVIGEFEREPFIRLLVSLQALSLIHI